MPRKYYLSYEEAKAAFKKSLTRGLYYHDQGENDKCVQEYVDVLQAICSLYRFWSSPRNLKEFHVARLFELYDALQCIMGVAPNRKIDVYLAFQLKIIEEKLAEYEKVFTVEEIKEYNDNIRNPKGNFRNPMTVDLIIAGNRLRDNEYSLEEIKKFSYKEEQDPILKDIREVLSDISSYKFEDGTPKFPLVLEKQSSGCFIATAAYSTPIHPDLDTFRAFRDEKLLTHWIGNKLVEMYYQLSPSVAEYINQKPRIKRFVRRQLESLATWMRNQGITKN